MSWLIDDVHSRVGFSVKHLMVTTVRGQFKKYRGTLHIDPSDFARSSFETEIDVISIDTGNAERDDQLRTNDFFDAPNHPKIIFKSKRIEPKAGGNYIVHGDLTIRGVTKSVALEVVFRGTSKDMKGKTIAGIGVRGIVDRKDFGVRNSALLEAGGVAVGEKVKIEIDAEVIAPDAVAKTG